MRKDALTYFHIENLRSVQSTFADETTKDMTHHLTAMAELEREHEIAEKELYAAYDEVSLQAQKRKDSGLIDKDQLREILLTEKDQLKSLVAQERGKLNEATVLATRKNLRHVKTNLEITRPDHEVQTAV